jgi:hypothetical protein
MPMHASRGDRAFDDATAEEAEARFRAVAAQVLDVLNARDKQVTVVMEHYDATNVAPEYQGKEKSWNAKGYNTRQTITLLEQCLVQNRGHADDANKKAGNAVASMM